jgi:hypothetical protein
MKRELLEVVAISPEPGAVMARCRECNVFLLNNLRKPPQCFVRIHFAVHEQPVVY